jgi:hypothetical protein
MQQASMTLSLPAYAFLVRVAFLSMTLATAFPLRASFAQNAPVASEAQMIDSLTQKTAANRLLENFGPTTPIDKKVAHLIDSLAASDRDRVQTAVTALVLLGNPAVPDMIRRVDDGRDMLVKVIVFENRSPEAFEAVAQLGVAKVIDCLNIILTVSTGHIAGPVDLPSLNFSRAEPGRGTDALRNALVKDWREYLARLQAAPRASGKSLPSSSRRYGTAGPDRGLPSTMAEPPRCGKMAIAAMLDVFRK